MESSKISFSHSKHSQLEYNLQCLSRSSTLRILKAHEISNPKLTVQFERKSKNLLVLESWIPISVLKEPNSEEQIVKNGFTFPEPTSGHSAVDEDRAQSSVIFFPVGPINLSDSFRTEDGTCMRMLMCKIAVGRSFCSSLEECLHSAPPDGYQSLYVDPNPDSRESLSFCSSSELSWKHRDAATLNFVLRDTAQVLPCYIVEFEYDPKKEKQSRQRSICENCEKSLAVVFCQADSALLCSSCDRDIHLSKLTGRHRRISLEKGPQCVGPCREHPDRLAEYFCSTCHVVVCLSCKMIGGHSAGDFSKHQLVNASEAYQSVVEASRLPDPVIEERKKSLVEQLEKVEKRGEHLLRNARLARDHIESIYKKALSDLDSQILNRMKILKGDAQEIKRLFCEIDRIQDFLVYLESGRDANLFLLSWHQYLQAKAELPLLAFSLDRSSFIEYPLQITGGIHIVAGAPFQEAEKSSLAASTYSLASLSSISMCQHGKKSPASYKINLPFVGSKSPGEIHEKMSELGLSHGQPVRG